MRSITPALLLTTLITPLWVAGCGTDQNDEADLHTGPASVRDLDELVAEDSINEEQIFRCDIVVPDGPLQSVDLRLDTRAGESAMGYSLATQSVVPAADADLLIRSWDCGARGRWVDLLGEGVSFCAIGPGVATADLPKTTGDECSWSAALDIGGSNPAVSIGDSFLIARDDAVVARAILTGRTATPFEWMDAEDLGYDVHLDMEMLTP